MSAIYSAEYIITNSFHATVFSILFKKMFCSYAVSRTGTRVRDFYRMLVYRSANLRTLIVRSLNSIVRWIGMQYLRMLQVNEKHQ